MNDSLLFPDVTTEAGRRSAVWRGLAGGVIVSLIGAGIPPPIGAMAFLVFAAITVGMYLGQPWAARAGVVAAFAPLVTVNQNMFATLSQCVIVAYFFFSAWRGLRARTSKFAWLSAMGWLALSLSFVVLSSLTANRVPVPAGTLPEVFQAGDWVLLQPAAETPRPGDVVLVKPVSADAAPEWRQVKSGDALPPVSDMQIAKWIVWSDESKPGDPLVAYYTKARWGRFPKKIGQ